MWKKLISLNLVLLLLLGLFPAGVLAEETAEPFPYDGYRVAILSGPEGEAVGGVQADDGTVGVKSSSGAEIWYRPWDSSVSGLHWGTLEDETLTVDEYSDAEGIFRFSVSAELCGVATPVVLFTADGMAEQYYLGIPAQDKLSETVLMWRPADMGEWFHGYDMSLWFESTHEMEIVARQSGGDTPLLSADLTPAGDFFRLEDRDDHSIYVYMDGFGAGSLSYEGASLGVQGVGPEVAFFSQPEYNWAYYVQEVAFTGEPLTLYLANRFGNPLGTARETTANGAEFAYNSDGTVITVTLTAANEEWLNVDMESDYTGTFSASLRINDLTPHLCWRRPDVTDWDRITGEPIYGPGSGGESREKITEDYRYEGEVWQFLWWDGENLIPLTTDQLTFSGVACGETVQDDFTRVTFSAFGEGSVSYNGSSIAVSASTPMVALYTSPEVKLEYLLGEFWNWTGADRTVYALAADGRLTDLELDTWQPVTADVDTANGWVSLTLTGVDNTAPRNVSATFTGETGEGVEINYWLSTIVQDCTPALYAGGVRWETDPDTGEQIPVAQKIKETPPVPPDGSRDVGYLGGEIDSMQYVQFWLRQPDGSWTKAAYGDLIFEGDNFEAREYRDGIVRLDFSRLGEGRVSYNAVTHLITARVETFLPYIGFYSAPEATAENYLTEWAYKGDGDTIYLVSRNCTLINAVPMQTDAATVTLHPEMGYAEISDPVVRPDGGTQRLEFSCQGEWYSSGAFNRHASIQLRDAAPGLVIRWADMRWDGESRIFSSMPGEWVKRSLTMTPGSTTCLEFMLRDSEENLIPVNVSELTMPEGLLEVVEAQGQFALVKALGFGSGNIVYAPATGAPAKMIPVTSDLPDVGFYLAPEASPENFLSELRFTGEPVTVYLICRSGTLDMVQWRQGASPVIDFTPGTAMAALTLSACTVEWMSIEYMYTGSARMSGISLNIRNAQPGLVWRWADGRWDESGLVFTSRTGEAAQNAMQGTPGNDWWVEFLWRDSEGGLTPVNADDVALPEGILEFESTQGQYAVLRWTGFGSGSIGYAPTGAAPSAISVESSLPSVGFYRAPEATEENYLTEWRYTADSKTVYFVSRGKPLNQVTCSGGAEPVISFTPGDMYAEITLNEYTGNGMNIRYALTGSPSTFTTYLRIVDARPGLVWRWAGYDHATDAFYTEVGDAQTRSLGSCPGYTWFVEFLWRNDAGELEPISAADLVMPEGVGEMVQSKDQYAAIRWTGFGEGVIQYAPGGEVRGSLPVRVSLPNLGFYSAPIMRQENYISADSYHGDLSAEPDKTVYLVLSPIYASSTDLEIYNVQIGTAATAVPVETEIVGDNRAVRITQTMDVPENQNLELTLLAHSHETDQIYEFKARLFVMGHRQELLMQRILEPRAEYAFEWRAYSGMGRGAGETLYILPLLDPDTREPYTGDLTCTEEGVVELALYDAENHIWSVTFLTDERKPAFLAGTADGVTRYITVNPGGAELPGERMLFDVADPPHDDFRPAGVWADNTTVVAGDSLLFRLRIGDRPVTGTIDFDGGVVRVEEYSLDGLEGVYRITGVRPAWTDICQGGAFASIGVMARQRQLEFVEAKAPTETEPGNIPYFRDLDTGRVFVVPECADGPDRVLTRAELCRILAAYMAWDTSEWSGMPYTDVDTSTPEGQAVMLLSSYGIVGGYPDGTFHPDEPVTRAQAAKIICAALNIQIGIPANAELPEDVSRADWFFMYACAVIGRGFLRTDRTDEGWFFRPNETLMLNDIDAGALMCFTVGTELKKAETLRYLVRVDSSGSGRAWADTYAAKAGDTVNLFAEPAEGFSFNGWRIVSGAVTAISHGSFVMPEGAVILEARWESVAEGVSIDTENTALTETGTVEVALDLAPAEADRELRVLAAAFTEDGQYLGIREKTITVKAGATQADIEAQALEDGAAVLRIFVLTEQWVPLADYLDLTVD